jgi:nucleoside-diphosphate-sugar epimerase
MWTSWALQFLVLAIVSYAFLLGKRLDTSRHVRTTPFPSDEQLLEESEDYKSIDVLEPSIRSPTNKRYLITGGFGQLGLHGVVDLLYRRGERAIHILDVASPPSGYLPKDGIIWHNCDLSSEEAVKRVFEEVQPDVVFALAAVIRFWERHTFSHRYSTAVNVDGTRNVLQALGSLPSESEKILIYCSSAAVSIAAPQFMRLGRNWTGEYASYTVSDEKELPEHRRASHSYVRSKYAADKLVREWNGRQGLRTGVVSIRTVGKSTPAAEKADST